MIYIFGLGNPGLKYRNTRHNAGFKVVDILAGRHGIKLKNAPKMDAYTGQGLIGDQRVMLIKPQTFMNESGYAVSAVSDYYNADLKDIIVLYDDIDIEKGLLRIREKGSAGTHNGMRSIIGYLGSGDFMRLRIGIGKPEFGSLKSYVLGKMDEDMKPVLDRAADSCETIILQGVQAAQEKYQK